MYSIVLFLEFKKISKKIDSILIQLARYGSEIDYCEITHAIQSFVSHEYMAIKL